MLGVVMDNVKFKVGDRVYDKVEKGWGTIKSINYGSAYPIVVHLDHNLYGNIYKIDGRYAIEGGIVLLTEKDAQAYLRPLSEKLMPLLYFLPILSLGLLWLL